MNKVFTIECEMEERWVPHFIGFLKELEDYGKIGHSEAVAFYADGCGDFRPRFYIEEPQPYEIAEPRTRSFSYKIPIFDAG